MTTTATAPEYRALTDPLTKTWHLGSVERGESVLLRYPPDDPRATPARLR